MQKCKKMLQLACSRREQRKQHTSELIYTLELGGYRSRRRRRFESFSANWGEVETTSAASPADLWWDVGHLSLPPVAVSFIIIIVRNRNFFDVPFRQFDCGCGVGYLRRGLRPVWVFLFFVRHPAAYFDPASQVKFFMLRLINCHLALGSHSKPQNTL